MIVVAAGSSTRFGSDKLMTRVAGAPLVEHTVSAVRDLVDACVLVCRADQLEAVKSLRLGVEVVPGGATRTASEMAGLAALGDSQELVGIHDGARPLVTAPLVEELYRVAASHDGAIPTLEPGTLLIDRRSLEPVPGLQRVQTPQVFGIEPLMGSYVAAARSGYEGKDTADVVLRHSSAAIASVPGDPANIKVTYPSDLNLVEQWLQGPSRT